MDDPTLLIVDDEVDLATELKALLERSGYKVVTAADGERALTMVRAARPDLIILDVLMPQLNGREVLRRLRAAGDWTPVILLTQIGTPAERAMSLQEGADDYISKPFDPMELIARIEAVLRRVRRGKLPLASHRFLSSDDLVLDRQARQVTWRGMPLQLTARALGVLEFLMLHAGEVIARDRLLDEVWGWAQAVETRAVDNRIAELRKVLDDDPDEPLFIETIVGVGYRFLLEVTGK